ncbi:MAG: hypothetical protein EHM45_22390 [Desulfobacteraceae bacterium]|nr:MAG: hypothetical protein EHM45_22390 [Desulfobacteraceae bacterium]
MKKKTMISIAVAAALLVTVAAWYARSSSRKFSGEPEAIRIAYSPFISATLFWIAEERGFFAENGLSVTVRKFDSGAEALNGVLNAEADVAVGLAEFPLVRKTLLKEKIRAFGNIDKTELIHIVGRKDRGILSGSDLKGKTVGTALKTVSEFYLGVFLNQNGLTMQDIKLRDLKTPAQWVNAVADGEIDAICIAQPYVDLIQKRLADKAVVWPAQGGQPLYSLLVSGNEWLAAHPQAAKRFLKALAQAEEYVVRYPAEAKAIAGKRLNLESAYLEKAWPQNRFELSLDQALIATMEDQARWMIKNNLTEAKEMPDFLDSLSWDALEQIKPEAVTVIH